MNIQEYVHQKQAIQNSLLLYIDKDDELEENYDNLIGLINNYKIKEDHHETKLFFYLIASIVNNHYRSHNFFAKIEKILLYFKTELQDHFTLIDILKIFQKNNRILLFLIQEKIITIDLNVINLLLKYFVLENNFDFTTIFYFFPEVKTIIESDDSILKSVDEQTYQQFSEKLPENYEKKRKLGENDGYICELIRNDSIDEFISYVNQKSIPLTSEIERSIYETNTFLLRQRHYLIEYAAFFGSVQIFKYLYLNQVKLNKLLWIYAIHGDNPEIIHILEEKNLIKQDMSLDDFIYPYPFVITFHDCVREAIKCFHNDIANYIQSNYIDDKNFDVADFKNSNYYCFKYFNLALLSLNSDEIIDCFKNACEFALNKAAKNKHIDIIELLFSQPIKKIISSCFEYCFELESITIPSSITEIGDKAFKECEKLKSITIPSSVKTIGKSCFIECCDLEDVTFLAQVTEIPSCLFKECTSLKKLIIPPSVTKIDINAFDGCTKLTEISIPSTITDLGAFSFSSCISLESIEIPNIRIIGKNTFEGCASLLKIVIPPSVVSIRACAFFDCCSLVEIMISDSVTSIGDQVFAGCSSLKEIVIPSSVHQVGKSLFDRCSSLTHVTIPASLKSRISLNDKVSISFT